MVFDVEWQLSQFVKMVLPAFVPFAIAAVIAWWPDERPKRKLTFVVVSEALVFGLP